MTVQRTGPYLLFLTLLLAAGCFPVQTPSAAPTAPATFVQEQPAPTATPIPARPAASPTGGPEPTQTSVSATEEGTLPEEAILILEPGPGARLVSPARISGIADPTFEQSLVLRILSDDGELLAEAPAQIAADIGERGPFEAEIPFTVSGDQHAFIQVLSISARDGGITHLASTGVTLSEYGPAVKVPVEPRPEQIVVFHPAPGEQLSGGLVRVEGFALASFEQTLVIEILDELGNVIGSQPVIVQAPDLGQAGPFSAEVAYSLTTPGAGRLVVRDPSAAFAGDVHVSTIEIHLAP